MNITRTPWFEEPRFSSHPRYHLPKKRTTVSYQNPTLQTPSSPKHPGTDAGEDPHHQKTREVNVEHDHKALFPPTKPEHDTHLRSVHVACLLDLFRHDTSTSVSSAHRRRHGVDRGQPLTDPSPDTIPRIFSPFPVFLTESYPPPFKFAQEQDSSSKCASSDPIPRPYPCIDTDAGRVRRCTLSTRILITLLPCKCFVFLHLF